MIKSARLHKYPGHVMAIVMAGGQGSRLMPLTDNRSKPSRSAHAIGSSTSC